MAAYASTANTYRFKSAVRLDSSLGMLPEMELSPTILQQRIAHTVSVSMVYPTATHTYRNLSLVRLDSGLGMLPEIELY